MPTDDAMLSGVLESTDSHFYGKYRGLVMDNKDPRSAGGSR